MEPWIDLITSLAAVEETQILPFPEI